LPSKKDIIAHKIEFELKLLHLLGVYPQLEHCVICSKPVLQHPPEKTELNLKKNHLYQIDVSHGGVRCEKCFSSNSQSILINPGSLMFLNRWSQTLRNFKSLEIRPTRQNLTEIKPLIQESFKLHLPRQPKASSLLEKALDDVG
ncbi:MAG: DNA repair protein RecO C-terminal domain-containing protein, partial [SAR324 cluster bacterium]|nr:DNA repair protein RecO C-terminal domain-containing protein [SAR324 cluster bacterium]